MGRDEFVGRLPGRARRMLEWLFDADLAGVRIHVSGVPERLGAAGFASGEDVWIQPHRWDPESPEGAALLAHELAHVLQQRRLGGRAGEGAVLVGDVALEEEARRLGRAAAALVCREGVRRAGPPRALGAEVLRASAAPVKRAAMEAVLQALGGARHGATGVIQCNGPDGTPDTTLATPNVGSATIRLRSDGRLEFVAGLPEVAGFDPGIGARRTPDGRWQLILGPYPADPGTDLYSLPEVLELLRGIGGGNTPATPGPRFPFPRPPGSPFPTFPPFPGLPGIPGLPGLPGIPGLPGRPPGGPFQPDLSLVLTPIPGLPLPFVLPPLRFPPLDGNAHLVILDGFATAQSNVPGIHIPTLDTIASSLRAASPPPRVLVTGYTDSTGAPSYDNQALGLQRAQAVRDALVARRIDTAQIVPTSEGASSPVGDNATPEGRAQNRRVEIFWTTERFRLPPLSTTLLPPP